MPEQPMGYATWPGVERVEACSYTMSHGVTPGVATMEIVPQDARVQEQGDLVFIQGTTRIVLKDCKVHTANIRAGDEGFIVTLSIYDRRWKWQAAGHIEGHYNLRDDNNVIITETEKEPRQLAKLLLEAMGEKEFDVSQLPNDARPTVTWEYAAPATELEQMAGRLGCRVVLGLDNRVRLCQAGSGGQLPNTGTEESANDGFDPPEKPDKLLLVAAKTRFQADLRLEPVGYEADGTLLPIDSLSYKPSGGWEDSNPPHFSDIDNEEQQALAKRYVFRLYRFTLALWDGTGSNEEPKLYIPGAEEATIIHDRRFLELEDVQVETFTDAITGQKRAKPAAVRGEFYGGGAEDPDDNDPFPTPYLLPFSIVDKVQGLIEFQSYIWKLDANQRQVAPDLVLRCAVSVRHPDTWHWFRRTKEKATPGEKFGTKERVIFREEIVENIYPVYGPDTFPTGAIVSNRTTIEPQMDYYLNAAMAEYQAIETRERTYPGLLPISPDGAIQQVSWSVDGESGPTTRASRNTEFSLAVPEYNTRRFFSLLADEKIVAAATIAAQQRAKK